LRELSIIRRKEQKMKNLILASMIAFAGTAAFSVPTQAASLTIQTDDNQYSPNNGDIYVRPHRHYDNMQYNDNQYSDTQYNDGHHRHWQHRCHTELVRHWRHHHRVTEEVKVCG